MTMLTRYLLLGAVLALVLVVGLSACTAQGGISILPTGPGGGASATEAIPITVLVALAVTALVVVAIASLRP
jgi:hypothetical protein